MDAVASRRAAGGSAASEARPRHARRPLAALARRRRRRPARARAEKPQIVFPQGSEQPLAALQDIDVIEHLGDRVPGRPRVHRRGAASRCSSESLLGRGKPVLVTLGYYRCPMLCGLVLDGLVKARSAARASSWARTSSPSTSASIPPRTPSCWPRRRSACSSWPAAATTGVDWPFWSSVGRRRRGRAALADAVGFRYKYDATSKQFAHDAVAFVLTPEGTIARYLYGVDYPARDFRMARGRGQRRPGRHLVRQGAAVLLPVRPRDAAVRAVRDGVHAHRSADRVRRSGGAARRALAQGDRNAETPRGHGRSREGGMNDLMRRLLWLPEQASTFAPKVDNLHYFVITVTMLASIADGPAGVLLLLQVPRAPRATSRRRSCVPSVQVRDRSSSACRCSSSCSGSCRASGTTSGTRRRPRTRWTST